MDLPGIGPIAAARILADVGDVSTFADRNRFASWSGTAPLDASSGEQIRHRLSRADNRKINHMLHMAALSQIRLDTEGRAYCRHKRAAGKTHLEALRCLKRRISDAINIDSFSTTPTALLVRAWEGKAGRLKNPTRPNLPPHIGTSDQPLPDPHARRYAARSRARKSRTGDALQNAG
ncbi:transposase [Nocardioides pantholopis]|uniref:transposase n=1 Tax=Nocardioides pantholopis TaxID=2483798 RepID=UPI0019CFCCAE|nr:transposase [Nocardioides pantholopis]